MNPIKHFISNVYTMYLNKYVAESIVETKTATITLTNVSANSFYTYLNCNNVKLSYGIYTKNNPNKLEPCELNGPFVDLTDVLKYNGELVKKAVLSNNERTVSGITYFSSDSNPIFIPVSIDNGISIYVPNTTFYYNGYDSSNNFHIKEVGKLRLFQVYKYIDNGKLINFSLNKYCYAIEGKDTYGNNRYQFLGFYAISEYFGNLTNDNDYQYSPY
jgi:hypothetical protein